MTRIQLKAEKRKLVGRRVKKLRTEGLLPANIYGKGVKSTAITVSTKEFKKAFDSAGETALVDLVIGKEPKVVLTPKEQGSSKTVLIRNVQRDPVNSSFLHVDFQQVDLKEKVTANIPVETLGESPAEKQGLGTAVEYINEVEVEALPANLPDKFEVDISNLAEVDQSVLVKDLVVDKSKVTVLTDPESIIVKVEPPTKEEEAPAPAPTETPVAPVEGEAEKPSPQASGEESEQKPKTEEKPKV